MLRTLALLTSAPAIALLGAGCTTSFCDPGFAEAADGNCYPVAGDTLESDTEVDPGDTTPPVITLNGDSTLDVDYASLYEDAGAWAIDDVDGTVEVTVEGDVDTFTSGEQTVTYVASDAAGNVATETRAVTVSSPTYQLDVSLFGQVEVSTESGIALVCSPAGDMCSQSFAAGTEVVLTPAMETGWSFEYWRACDAVEDDRCTLTMDGDRMVLATTSSDAPLEYRSEVRVLDDDQLASVFSYEADNDVLFFEAGADIDDFEIGEVLVAVGEGPDDLSFARRIIDIVTLSGSITTVQTIDVPLDEVIDSGTLIAGPGSFQPFAEVVKLAPGVASATQSAPGDPLHLTVAGLVLWDGDDVTITATGTIDVEFDPEVALDFDSGIRAFRLSGESVVDASLGIEIAGAPDSLSVETEYPLPAIRVGWVIVGPAVFVVEVVPYVTFEAGISVSVEPRVTVLQEATLGVQWHRDSDWTNLTSYDLDTAVEFAETLEASARAQIGGGLKPTFKLYGVVGPYLKSEVYGGGEIVYEPFLDCPLSRNIFAGFKFNAGGEITILSSRLAIESNDLFVEKILYSDTFECEDVTAPDAPLGTLAVAQSTSTIRVGWQSASDDVGVTHYEVWRRDSNLGAPHRVAEVSALEYTDAGLSEAAEYCYYVLAVDSAGNTSGIPLDLACATTLEVDDEAPSAPKLLSAHALSTTSVALAWSDAIEGDDVVGYIVKDTTDASLPFSIALSTTSEASITRLNAETEYCYRVSAVDAHGNESEDSNELCVTTDVLSNAEWTMYIGCEDQDFILENHLDLDEDVSSEVIVVGTGYDYSGTGLAYALVGEYEPSTYELSADIYWSFEESEDQRIDRFTADLSTGDSGVVVMEQIEVTGCDAQIQFTSVDSFAPGLRPFRPRTDIVGFGG